MHLSLEKHWHNLSAEQTVEHLGVDPDKGLDLLEIQQRHECFGENKLKEKKRDNPFIRFLLQFNNPLLLILLASSVITAFVKDLIDALVIFAAVLINAILSYLQETRAEAAIEALASSLASETTVLRAGETRRIQSVELIPGDIVILNAGDRVPADMRIIASKGLFISEAALTGESVPSEKDHSLVLPEETLLADRHNMVYASTLVASGTGKAVVTATGNFSEIGHISEMISEAEQIQTPLTKKIASFSKVVMAAILALAAGVMAISLARGEALADTLFAAIALAVAMIPEGLPTAMTVTLAIGVQRMARRRAIIRRLPAVEALGSTTVICTDKTGTLTQNQMTVSDILTAGNVYQLPGSGFIPEGGLFFEGHSIKPDPGTAVYQILLCGLLCNESSLSYADEKLDFTGDPTEIALLTSAMKAGLRPDELKPTYPRIDSFPFDSKNHFMATLHATKDGRKMVFLKGALEVLLARSESQFTAEGRQMPLKDSSEIESVANQLAANGKRVLAFAYKELSPKVTTLEESVLTNGLVFLGLQAMIDPPRPEAMLAVKACQDAGISVKMITGDHLLTAAAIARDIGIIPETGAVSSGSQIINGSDLAGMTDELLINNVNKFNVFSRVSPDQKLRLVKALQTRGEIVTMTGDGVNDGPALKQANIGVAMGITGTEVAKEASDMVLTDDNFATIEAAVEEGRSIFDNIIKIITWTVPTNIGEGLIILVALMLGEVLPIIPIQILWINMVTVGLLGIVLAMEGKEPDIMRRLPRKPAAPIIPPQIIPRIFFVGVVILLAGFQMFEWELRLGSSLATARSAAVNSVVFIEIFFLFNSRSLVYSPFRIGFFKNRWLIAGVFGIIGLQMMFTYMPFMNVIFGSAALTMEAWWRILASGLLVFVLVEIEKALRQRSNEKKANG